MTDNQPVAKLEFQTGYYPPPGTLKLKISTSCKKDYLPLRDLSPEAIGLPAKFDKWRHNQEQAVSSILDSPKRVTVISAPTGFGKCLRSGTLILMYDGSFKPVEEVNIHDEVMGPDSSPRLVKSLTEGVDEMFNIVPIKGNSYQVNSQHVLSLALLADHTGKGCTYLDIGISDYLRRSAFFKHRAKGYRSPVDYKSDSKLPIDPYFLGLWLGDGTTGATHITNPDQEVVSCIYSTAQDWGLYVRPDFNKPCPTYAITAGRGGYNSLYVAMQDLGVIGDKHIPRIYRTASYKDRLALLAGILDSDGHLLEGCFEITQKVQYLAWGIEVLAQSLGLAAYSKDVQKGCQTGAVGTYCRIGISGNTDIIPTRIPRKQASKRQQIKNALHTGIKVLPAGPGKFYGFSLEGPTQHFLLSDCTVVHNSAVLMGAALASHKRTVLLTSTRSLADQYLSDFSDVGLVDIRGRANYPCDLKPDYSCEEGRVAKCPYWGSVACPYSQAETRVRSASIVVTSYAKWFNTSKWNGPFEGFQQIIMDEGHSCPEELAGAMQIVLHHKEIEETLGKAFLIGEEASNFPNWKPWAREAGELCTEELAKAASKVGGHDPKPSWIRHFTHMQNLQQRLLTLSQANSKDWIVDEIEDGFQFDPIRPARYAELKLFCRIPRVILTSATIRPKTLFMLGLSKERFDFLEFPSDFDQSRCPIYHIPTMRNDHHQTDFSMLYLKSDQIMARRGDRKGIIHTISWARRDEVLNCSKYSERMLSNIKGESSTSAIEEFRKAPPGTVLVSPSVGTGYDFFGNTAEYQIILKIPFQDGRSKIVKARQASDPEYGPYQAMQALVQMAGRIMRSKDDRGETMILDDHISWFRQKYSHFAPKSFHQFFKDISIVPPPPPKL